jgi:phosphoglycolate phosphatase
MVDDRSALSGAVIAFDLDGTLVDTAPDLVDMLSVLLRQEGLPPLPMDVARPLIGHGARRLIERGFQAANAPLDDAKLAALFDQGLALYAAHIADKSRPYPGVAEALGELRDAGAVLAVCTNKPTELSISLLEKLGLAHFFAAIVGPDIAQARKPDPRHLQAAIAAAGGDPARAVMVGDAITDAAAARAAGVALILVSFGYTEAPAAELSPDILIDGFAELPVACVRLLGACGS